MTFDWQALLAGVRKAVADATANKPLPPAVPPTTAQLLSAAKAGEAAFVKIQSLIATYPAVITGTDDILEAFTTMGSTSAPEIEAVVNATPGALQTAINDLPELIALLDAIQPMPAPLPGEGPRIGRG